MTEPTARERAVALVNQWCRNGVPGWVDSVGEIEQAILAAEQRLECEREELLIELAIVKGQVAALREALIDCGACSSEGQWCAEGCMYGSHEYDTGAEITDHVSWCVGANAALADTAASAAAYTQRIEQRAREKALALLSEAREELAMIERSAPEVHGDGKLPERTWKVSYPLDRCRALIVKLDAALATPPATEEAK